MNKIFIKALFFSWFFTLSAIAAVSAQSIVLGTVDPGPYGQGSSISVPFTLDNTSGCIAQDNKFELYLSDATGSFAAETKIGSFTGFYATFVNGVIPASTPAGSVYKVRIKSTSPVTVSSPSAAFTVNAVPAVVAGTSSIFIGTANPEVFGSCNGVDNSQYFFSNESTPGSAATAHFYNELTKADAGTFPLDMDFNARLGNYTVTVKATKGGIVGTKSYIFINNVTVNSFAVNGSTTVCLNGSNNLTFTVDISDSGIKRNYPGLLYRLDWGDGTTNVYTICEIIAMGGNIGHTYTRTSCGNSVNGQNNVFKVEIQPTSPYCADNVVAPITTFAKILIPAENRFSLPVAACLGSPLPIPNSSDPGMDPNSSANGCENTAALYTWLVDGVVRKQNVNLSYIFDPYTYITTTGIHTITLRQQSNTSLCPAADVSHTVCIQAKPVPVFSLSSANICPETVVAPGNTSTIDNNCNNSNSYNWAITGPDNVVNNTTNVVFTGGTNQNSQFPQFLFHTPGIYRVQLGITTASCGTELAPEQTIIVNNAPTAVLSADILLCGKNQTLNFDTNNGVTKTTLSGTINEGPNTYTWTVAGAGGYTFTGSTDLHTKYPQIKFTDYGVYTVTVVHNNNCGSVTDSQQLTFQPAPEVDAGPDQTICEGTQAALTGTITDPDNSVISYSWVGGGNAVTNGNTLNASYTPTAAEISAGQVTLTLRAITSSMQCNIINNDIVIYITKKDNITSVPAKTICSGQNSSYTITSTNTVTTFAWTAAVTTGTATGFTAAGNGNLINDAVINTGNANAVVTYNIIPTTNGCPGNPFVFRLTVKPLPVITAVVANPSICSNQPAGITVSSNVTGTTYTWTSTAAAGVTGNFNRTTGTSTGSIQDILVNNGAVAGDVTYTITPFNGTCAGAPVTSTVTVQPLPKTAYAGPDDDICNSPVYTLQGNSPLPGTGKWTVISGQAGITFSDDANPNAVVNGLVQGNIYKFKWTITASPSCPASSSMVNITNTIETVGGAVTASATVCSGSNAGTLTLSGQVGGILRWEKSTDNGVNWLAIANTTTTLNYLNLTQTTQYRALVQNSICSVKISAIATITVNPATVTANAGTDITTCSVTSLTLAGNNPAPFAGIWTQTGGPAVTIVNPANAQTQVNGLISGFTYKFTWTIKGLPPCGDSSDELTIINANETVGGTVAGSVTVCGGSNSGTLTLSGHVGQILRWERSTDNGLNWQTLANTTTSQNYTNLTQTTQYRAVVQNTICSIKMSAAAIITVNQPTVIANAGIDINACNITSITLSGNNPTPFAGMWTQTGGPPVTIVNPSNALTQVTGLAGGNIYKFTWTIKGSPPCTDSSDELVITDNADVVASFTADNNSSCGSATVKFTNTSSKLIGTSFIWNFGDGTPQSTEVSPQHTFVPRADGKQAVYTVSLNIVNNCVPRPAVIQNVIINPAVPLASILPDNLNGCGAFAVSVQNVSPGINAKYVFYLYDGNTLVQSIIKTDKSPVLFNAITTTTTKRFTLYMIATDLCGTTAKSAEIPITITPVGFTPQMFLKNGLDKGCAPLTVTFINNSAGGDVFSYNIYNEDNVLIENVSAGKNDFPYVFTKPGTYFVTIKASDNCTTLESLTKMRVDVFPAPAADFNADLKTGCTSVSLNLTNLTIKNGSTPASSLTYEWDFGDGSAHYNGFIPKMHTYDFKGSPYTVTLTVTNPATGCSNTMVKKDFIIVSPPPLTNFIVKPDTVTSIPNYRFEFADQTANKPIIWQWTFGDGASSSLQNPEHTYADTGTYKVTLKTFNKAGCDSTISHKVKITGIPGQLYLPNAFTPNGLSSELRTYTVKGSGIAKWHLQIFNNWGQQIWETTKLNEKGEPDDSWDGTYKGVPVQQGVYIWQASATYINGTEWKGMSYNKSLPKKIGVIHLIK